MKQALVFVAAMLFGAGALAHGHLADERHAASQLCVAALDSKAAVKAKAKELGMSHRQVKQVSCSLAVDDCRHARKRSKACDLSLAEFARFHGGIDPRAIATVQ